MQLKCLPCPSRYCRGPSESGRTASLVIVTQRVDTPNNLFDSKKSAPRSKIEKWENGQARKLECRRCSGKLGGWVVLH